MLWKTVLAISSVMTLIFAIDDLVGEPQLKRIEEWWLSKSVMFFQEWRFGVRSIGGLWSLLAYAFAITLLPLLGPLILLLLDMRYPRVTIPEWTSFLIFLLFLIMIPLLAFSLIAVLLSKPTVRMFLKSHGKWWEIRYLRWLRKLLVWAQLASRRIVGIASMAGRGEAPVELPYLIAVVAVMITMPLVLVSSLLLRGGLLFLGITVGVAIYVPPIMLHEIARRTGSEHFFRVGKYVVLLLTTILALVQMLLGAD
jgi:MFS family permease